MSWDTLQQFIRILMHVIGAALGGEGFATGDEYQGLVGGAVSVAAFVWWAMRERRRKAEEAGREPPTLGV